MRKLMSLPAAGAVVVVVTLASLLSAQPKPNFSGTWVTVSPAEHAGQEETIKQDERTLTLSHASEGGGHGTMYTLDGSPSRSETPSHGEQIVSVSTASWNGDQLVILSSTTYPDGKKINSKLTFALNADGQLVRGITHAVDGKERPTITVVMKRK